MILNNFYIYFQYLFLKYHHNLDYNHDDDIFEKSKEFRKAIIKAGQDTDKPDFGRK